MNLNHLPSVASVSVVIVPVTSTSVEIFAAVNKVEAPVVPAVVALNAGLPVAPSTLTEVLPVLL